MTKEREALKLAQKAMGLIGADLVCEAAHHEKKDRHQIGEPCPIQARWHQAFAAIKEVLAQHDSVQAKPEPEQEPVAVVNGVYANRIEWKCTPKFFPADGTNLYTTSPQRKPLTRERLVAMADVPRGVQTFDDWVELFGREIEAAHGITGDKK